LGDDQPLIGDLVEEWPRRSIVWFWRQVLFAMWTRAVIGASATLREPQRLAEGLASMAMVLVVSFQMVVAGSLLDDLIRRLEPAHVTGIHHPEWLTLFVLLSLPAAWIIGTAMSHLHRRSRVATVLAGGASAAIAAAVTVAALSPTARLLFPAATFQIAAAMLFVLALLRGGFRASRADRHVSS
jgi:hypothetical protein